MKRAVILLVCLALSVAVALRVWGANRNVDTESRIESFDLKRYLGRWYEIARFDHSFERGMTDVTATYTMRDDGMVEVLNRGVRDGEPKEAVGKAKLTDQIGVLKVSFFWFFYSEYRILALDPNYQWALVGSKSQDYLWVLSRTQTMPSKSFDYVVGIAKNRGYDVSRLIIDNDM